MMVKQEETLTLFDWNQSLALWSQHLSDCSTVKAVCILKRIRMLHFKHQPWLGVWGVSFLARICSLSFEFGLWLAASWHFDRWRFTLITVASTMAHHHLFFVCTKALRFNHRGRQTEGIWIFVWKPHCAPLRQTRKQSEQTLGLAHSLQLQRYSYNVTDFLRDKQHYNIG